MISHDDMSHPWLVSSTETVEGIEFIKLARRDSGFSRFISGKCRGVNGMGWLDVLKGLRTKATIKACCDTDGGLFQSSSRAALKRNRQEAKAVEQAGNLPKIVAVEVPAVTYDGNYSSCRVIKVLASLEAHACLQVECSQEVLTHVRLAMLESEASSQKRTRRPKGQGIVRTLSSGVIKATRNKHNKSFKVKDEAERDDTYERAVRWANGDDDSFSDQDQDDQD